MKTIPINFAPDVTFTTRIGIILPSSRRPARKKPVPPIFIRRAFSPGETVKVVNLQPGFDGQIGKVVGLAEGQDENALIVSSGTWTVDFGGRRLEVQRNHLRKAKA